MIQNKKIIFIAPSYFNYHELIIENLEKNGFSVDFLEDINSGFLYTLFSKSAFVFKKYKESFQKKALSKLKNGNYDLMIVIGGKAFDLEFWSYIKDKYDFKKILYQWDSLKNFDYRGMSHFFDVVKTFDSVDAKNQEIVYLPLFYKGKIDSYVDEDIDLLFIGIWHSDRIEILNKITEYANVNNLKFCFKVYYPRYMYLYLVYVKKCMMPSNFFIFKTVSTELMTNYYQRAKCIIDINHPDQSGLTMRTIETIGRGKKLITTNSHIKQESFYNDKMIQVIDRENIVLNNGFFELKEDYNNIERLEISNWINELLK